jgi:aminopeptidase N
MRRKSVFWLVLIMALVLNTFQMALAQEPGADNIGDPFYGLLGNGGYDVQHYTLDLTVDVAANTIDGTATIDARATQDLSAFNLDFVGFTISAITVDGAAAAWDHQPHELTITPAEPLLKDAAFTVSVAYSGTPTGLNVAAAGSMPYLSGWVNFGDGVFVASEPAGAAGWYPVNDHPLDKATYTLRITVPKPYMVAANGLLQDTMDNGATTTYGWELDDPAASYLISVSIGEFEVVTEDGPDGVLIRNYFPPKYADLAQFTFGRTSDMIAFFEDLFGPYPFDAYGVVVANTEVGFALENQTLSLFGVDRVTATGLNDEVVAHELSHQWVGDSVSLATWGDIWLNEGFATYASWLWFEHASNRASLDRRVTDAYNQIAADTRNFKITFTRDQFLGLVQAMSADVSLPAEDVAQITRLLLTGTPGEDQIDAQIAILPPETVTAEQLAAYVTLLPFDTVTMTPAQVDELFTLLTVYDLTDEPLPIPASHFVPPGQPNQRDLFNRGVYLRGALTLHALRLKVGDEAFFTILKTYYTRYQGGNATTADFVGVAEEISGQDLQAFFDEWLYAPVMPDIPDMGLSVTADE